MPFLSLMAAIALLTGGPDAGPASELPLRIEKAWVREAPPGANVLAAYATFCNDADAAVTLSRVDSENFDTVEIHASVETESGVSMKRMNSVVIGPNECLAFEPGGRHFMLIGPKRDFRAGDDMEFTLFLANGKEIEIIVPVRRADEMLKHRRGHH